MMLKGVIKVFGSLSEIACSFIHTILNLANIYKHDVIYIIRFHFPNIWFAISNQVIVEIKLLLFIRV